MTVPSGAQKATPTRMTVLQVLPALHSGGAERSALEIARALVAAGHRSIVVSAGGRLVETLREQGSEHVTLDVGRKSLASLALVRPLRRLMAEAQVDIVHARSRLPAWLAWLALRGMHPRPRWVTTVHGLNSPGWYSAIMTRGDRVIVVSLSARDYVLQHYPKVHAAQLTVIPRGVDAEEFPFGYRPDDTWKQAFAQQYPELTGAPLMLLPARGTRLKGHGEAIRLLADLKTRGVPARLLLLGVIEDGRETYVAELRALADALGVSDALVFSPPRKDVRDIYAIAALVLQLSVKPESFGRTVIEALSLCRPVLG
ncbi:MAG: glycosyltransferase, partial [Xanthomonadales bacterium]|nr:glycosyltransferase [Xanthomonadales bacterium]